MNDQRLRGIGSMLLAVAFFAGMDAVLKLFAANYPPLEVAALRGAASLPYLLLLFAWTGSWRQLRPVNWQLHLGRGVLALIMLSGFIYAVGQLSLADAYAIFFVAPLFVTALSVPMLGEHVGWRRWLAILAGLLGVLWMLQPGATRLSLLGAIGALVAAAAYAGSAITARMLTRTDSTASMVFWFLVLLTVFAGLLALPDWVALERRHWWWLALLGLLGAFGQHFITEAFRCAPASVVAPFEY
ncbi:MAG: DMT family transporter, partial [Gammaproteobacteria bacterium]|nr:DMT family transporter [Gammaproteobacteria bacterium]